MAQLSRKGQEAEEVIHVLSMYGAVPRDQLLCLFPGKKSKMDGVVWSMYRVRRIQISSSGILSLSEDEEPDGDRLTALWVLADFIDRATYHSVGEYPVQLTFFAAGEVYEVVVVHRGMETLMDHAFWCQRIAVPPKRIVVVDEKRQAEQLHIQNTAGYCTVSDDGAIDYFQIEVNDEDE